MTKDPLLPGPFWLAGCGNMAGAMLDGWIAGGVDPAAVHVVRPSGRPAGHGIAVSREWPDGAPSILLLGMKPRQLDPALPALADHVGEETILISILAGVGQEALRARFPAARAIVQAMPNLPVRFGRGVVGLYSDSQDAALRALVSGLMAALGHAEWFDDEESYRVGGYLSGAGPAFLFRFVDGLAAAGAAQGLTRERALRLAVHMARGAAEMLARSDEGPEALAARVASPGGTTQAGLGVLDADDALARLLAETLEAGRLRSLEMAAEARRPVGSAISSG
jgi:pyrroline-5-carboxylate reductase